MAEDPHRSQLRAALNDILAIDDAVWAAFEPLVRHRLVAKSEKLIREGEVCSFVSFVVAGSFRFFALTESGDEAVNGFALEGDFLASMNALVDTEPSYFSVEALEPCEVLQFDWTAVQSTDYFSRLIELVSRDLFKGLERRQHEFLTCTPQERYQSFLARSPLINARVADRHIASFLGITPVHLSRIRRNIRNSAGS